MPQIFGIEHLLFVFSFLIPMITSLILIKKYCKSTKAKNYAIKIIGALLLLSIVFNRISISVYSHNIVDLIPSSFCGLCSFVFAISVLVLPDRKHPIFHFLIYLALLGGTITLVYPTFINQASSIFFAKTISGLLHHAFSLYLALAIIIAGEFTPCLKKWPIFVKGMGTFVLFGLFLITTFKLEDAMDIFTPLIEGTFLNWSAVFAFYSFAVLVFLIIYDKNMTKRKNENI